MATIHTATERQTYDACKRLVGLHATLTTWHGATLAGVVTGALWGATSHGLAFSPTDEPGERIVIVPYGEICSLRLMDGERLSRDDQEIDALAHFVMGRHYILDSALRVYAQTLTAQAEQTHKAYEQGKADPAVKAEQDASFRPNAALGLAVPVFTRSADLARATADHLEILIERIP